MPFATSGIRCPVMSVGQEATIISLAPKQQLACLNSLSAD